jgi:hypothetical protein
MTKAFRGPKMQIAYSEDLFGVETKYGTKKSCMLILDGAVNPDGVKLLKQAVAEAAMATWGDEEGIEMLKSGDVKNPIFSGATAKYSDGKFKPGMSDTACFIRPSTQRSIQSFDANRQKISLSTIKDGSLLIPVLTTYTFDHGPGSRGIGFGIQMLQYLTEGKLAGSTPSEPVAPLKPEEFFDVVGTEGAAALFK